MHNTKHQLPKVLRPGTDAIILLIDSVLAKQAIRQVIER
jgi:hypothetical protein